ncbi:hypothetical protein ACFSUS_21295 [Spirosoma soli]|uniref:Uncharacterized protein n=1 Tax=Spirosoma soli TaxID=1770529 RepID=A0ABW5M8A4_9BACT
MHKPLNEATAPTSTGGNKKWQTNVSPLRPPTLASVKTWGIQQELVAPICRCKVKDLLDKRPNFTRTFAVKLSNYEMLVVQYLGYNVHYQRL